ncbi:MAG: hypothetical protein Q4C70_13335, partial [Planctomycetia bacterium]|nr:hypothetical protein [Planctomycetia bacterium]
MYTPDGSETLYITELIFGNSDSCITFLSLNLDGMRPVYRDGRVILFNEISEAKSALRSSNCGAGMLTEIPCEIENKLDFAQAIIDLEDVIREKSETIEYTGNFVDCLQFFVDVYFDTIYK